MSNSDLYCKDEECRVMLLPLKLKLNLGFLLGGSLTIVGAPKHRDFAPSQDIRKCNYNASVFMATL
jgi:hypothetical protein